MKAIRRRLRRRALRRDGSRPEEEVFARFAERFGVREGKPKEFPEEPQEEARQERQRDAPPPPVPVVPASPALEVLGLRAGASKAEVAAAYKKLARAHHPDKVANESREIREKSEQRMKEINAAYSLLRRSGNGLGDGARTG